MASVCIMISLASNPLTPSNSRRNSPLFAQSGKEGRFPHLEKVSALRAMSTRVVMQEVPEQLASNPRTRLLSSLLVARYRFAFTTTSGLIPCCTSLRSLLVQTVEDKVLSLLPAKDRKKVLAMRSSATREEVEDEKLKLSEWLSGVTAESTPMPPAPPPPPAGALTGKDGDIFGEAEDRSTYEGKKSHPPIRGSKVGACESRSDKP